MVNVIPEAGARPGVGRRGWLRLLWPMLMLLPAWRVHAGALPLDVSWTFAREARSCVLEQQTPSGSARFSGEPGMPMRFEFRPRRDPFAPGEVGISADAPEWHPAWPDSRDRGLLAHVRDGVISADEPAASLLLSDLEQGRLLRLLGRGVAGGDEDVHSLAVLPTRLRESHRDFIACRQWEMPANFADMELSRIGFDSGASTLSAEGRARLDQLARYIRSDRMLSGILIDGHADSQGEQRAHLALSKRRAAAVAEHLVRRGIPRRLLVVSFHGAAYPLDSRQGASADARNRRVTVKLRRADAVPAESGSVAVR